MGRLAPSERLDMTPRDRAIAVAITATWGLNFVIGKWALAELPPILTMALRFALVAALLLPFVRTPWSDLPRIAGLSFTLGLVHFSLMFSGLVGVDAGLASIVAQSQVPFAALLGAIFLRDVPGPRQWLGMALAFFGIWLAVGEPRAGGAFGDILLMLAGSFVWAIANFQMKALGHVDGFSLNAYMALFTVPMLACASAVLETGQIEAMASASLWAWGGVVYMACIITIVTYWAWYRLLRRYSVGIVVPYSLLIPIFGVLAGVVLMGDPFGWQSLAGAAATVAGVAAVTLGKHKQSASAP
jgi:O-acetylserine/cysteine efflux transporter